MHKFRIRWLVHSSWELSEKKKGFPRNHLFDDFRIFKCSRNCFPLMWLVNLVVAVRWSINSTSQWALLHACQKINAF